MRTYKQIFFCLLIIVLAENHVYAQKYFVKHYTENDGLSNSLVSDMIQDTSGVMWFSTRSGISSYDGINWKTLTSEDGLYPGNYGYLYLDRKGIIWAASPQDELIISKKTNEKWDRIPSPGKKLPKDEYTGFEVFYKNDIAIIVVGTEKNGLYLYDGNTWKQISEKEGLSSKHVNTLMVLRDTVYVGTKNGLCILANNTVNCNLYSNYEFPDEYILGISSGNVPYNPDKKCIWICGHSWIGYLHNHKFSLLNIPVKIFTDGKVNNAIIVQHKNNGLYIGNPFYINYLDFEKSKSILLGIKNGLISEGASAILFDREDNLWISGYRGVNKIPSKRFSSYTKDEGLFDNEVTSIVELSPGNYVFGHHGGLTFYDGENFSYLDLKNNTQPGIHEVRVQDIEKDSKGNLWIAASRLGVLKITPDGFVTAYDDSKGAHGIVVSVLVFNDSTVLASTDDGLCILENNKFKPLNIDPETVSSYRKIFKSNSGDIYLTSYSKGITITDLKKHATITHKTNELANNTYSFLNDSRGNKWVGSVNGLYIIDDSAITKPKNPKLNINRSIYLIFEDNEGELWFGSDNGMYNWDGKELKNIGVMDGLAGHEINRDAGIVDHEGNIWIGTNNGLTYYKKQSDQDRNESVLPLAEITMIVSNGDTLVPDKPAILNSSSNNLTFYFRGISFINEDKNYYQCKLKGLEEEWSKPYRLSNDQHRYISLPPGHYQFCLRIRNAKGQWSKTVFSPEITIRPHFWFRWWFILLGSFILVFVILSVYRFVIVNRYNRKLKEEVALQTLELQKSKTDLINSNKAKDNFFNIIAHDLKNPFNSILGLTDLLLTEKESFSEKEKQEILENLKSVSVRTVNLLENLLTWARTQKGIIAFNKENINLKSIIDENINLAKSFAEAKNISLINLSNTDIWVNADENMASTVIRNLLSNALKFTYNGGRVVINSKIYGEEAEVCIKDNGTGMSEKEMKNIFKIEDTSSARGTGNETGTGLGLILCKEFVEKNGGKIWAHSKKDEGSTFCFTLPVSKNS